VNDAEQGQQRPPRLTPAQRRIVEAGAAIRADPGPMDFLHTVLAQTGLPYRDPGEEVRFWDRRQGNALLAIEAGRIADPRTGAFHPVGLPWGEKARLVLIHLTGEALRTGSPAVEVEDSLTAFVRELGLPTSGRSIRTVKDQLGRLSVATVRLAMLGGSSVPQVQGTLVSGLDLWAPPDARQRVLWPSSVRLSDPFFASIQRHAVPLSRTAIRALAHSALALDLYTWLAQRLHRIPAGKPQAIPWAAAKEQFGPGYDRMPDFRKRFRQAMREALTVYPGARVEEDATGLVLRNSPPPIRKRLTAGRVPEAVEE
jgi:hypothetical protein